MFKAIKYSEHLKDKWDNFIKMESVNGTFLQTRNFLEYHPKSRFDDESIMISDDAGNILCVIPGCYYFEDDKKVFFSHKGSSYGGLIINKRYYNTRHVQEMIDILEEYLRSIGIQKIIFKITPDIFCKEMSDLLQYMLFFNNYERYQELSTYIDYEDYNSDILSNFNYNKRKLIRRMYEKNLEFRELTLDSEVQDFYELLNINLSKYDAKPIHTLKELLEFKNVRLKDIAKFYGIYQGDSQLAGGMMFEFSNVSVVHAQNLSCDPFKNYEGIDSISFLYYSVIRHYKERGYKKLSWGVSTEEQGRILNFSLIKNKENYGSKYSVNNTFYKEL